MMTKVIVSEPNPDKLDSTILPVALERHQEHSKSYHDTYHTVLDAQYDSHTGNHHVH